MVNVGWRLALAGAFLCMMACTAPSLMPHAAGEMKQWEWDRGEPGLRQEIEQAQTRYRNVTAINQAGMGTEESSLEALRAYEAAVRVYLDLGFVLYRTYLTKHQNPPDALFSALNHETEVLMDIADEYLRQGSRTVSVGIASDVMHQYDLGRMTDPRRRAEAMLIDTRYREDY